MVGLENLNGALVGGGKDTVGLSLVRAKLAFDHL